MQLYIALKDWSIKLSQMTSKLCVFFGSICFKTSNLLPVLLANIEFAWLFNKAYVALLAAFP